MSLRTDGVTTLEQQEGQAVVRARELRVELERATVATDRVVHLGRLRERDRHVLEDARIVRMVAKRQPVRCQGGVIVALPIEREGLAQVVDPLWLEVVLRTAADHAAPPGHSMRTGLKCGECAGGGGAWRDARGAGSRHRGKGTLRANMEQPPRRGVERASREPRCALSRLRVPAYVPTGHHAVSSGEPGMSPRRYVVDASKGVLEVEWPLFGELSRALALKVAREYDTELVLGVATAGVIPGAVVAAILNREFQSFLVSRRYQADTVRDTPEVFGAVPAGVRGRRVLVVDETCDSGD